MHKLRLTYALLVLLLAFAAVAKEESASYRWKNVAIGGGGFITGLVFHPHEKGLLYARTDMGGGYRWVPAENRWQPILDWMGEDDKGRFGIESFAVDPSNPDKLYLAVGTYLHANGSNGAILRSSDRGATFQRASLPFKLGGNEQGRGNGERLAVDPNDGRVLLFGTRADGLWRSDDAGVNWREVKTFPTIAKSPAASVKVWNGTQPIGIAFVTFDAQTHTAYAGVSTRETSLYRSNDGGANWQAVPGQPLGLRPNHMVRDARGRWLLSYGDEPGPNTMNNGAMWRFDPANGVWEDVTPVPQSSDLRGVGFGWGAVATDARDADIIVASTFNRYAPRDDVFRSVDGGKTWKSTFENARFDHDSAPWTQDARPHWIGDLEIDPFDSERIWFVTGYGALVSRNARGFDGGAAMQWDFPMRGFEETVPLALLSPREGAHLVSGLGDIDGFVHDNLDVAQPRFAGPRYSNTQSLAVAGQSPNVMVRSGYSQGDANGQVRAAWSNDGGHHWTAFAHEPPQGEGAGHITLAADGKRVIWQPRNGGHWLTADFGGHWQAVKGLPKTAVVEADLVDEGIYYGFDATTGNLYVSGNGGVEFKQAQGGTGEIGDWFRAELRPHPQRSGEAWIAASYRGLLHWSPGKLVRLPGIENAHSVGLGKPAKEGDPPVLFVYGQIAGKTGLYRSDNNGKRWRRIDNDAQRFGGMIRHVTGDPRLHGRVYFGTEGRGIWYGDSP
ncbi:MAG: cellulase [Pseudoxanthomonas sp.]